MALTVTVTRSYTMVAGAVPSVDDWNAAFTPQVSVTGAVDTADISDGAITFPKLNDDFILGATTVLTSVDVLDKVLIGDQSGGVNGVVTLGTLWDGLQGLGSVATAFDVWSNDTITWRENATGTAFRMTIARLAENLIIQAPVIGAPTAAADGVLVSDASAAAGEKARLVDLDNLLPPVITAGTYTNPASIEVRADGRVKSITAGGVSHYEPAAVAVPGTGSSTDFVHLLARKPRGVRACLTCVTAEYGYSIGDDIELAFVHYKNGDETWQAFSVSSNATAITITRTTNAGLYIMHKTTGAFANLVTEASWNLRVEYQ